jgi:hypothetical protein
VVDSSKKSVVSDGFDMYADMGDMGEVDMTAAPPLVDMQIITELYSSSVTGYKV